MSKPETTRQYLNADKTKLVPEGDPEARFLAVANSEDEPPELEKPTRKAAAADTSDAVNEEPAAKTPAKKAAAKAGNKQVVGVVNKADDADKDK